MTDQIPADQVREVAAAMIDTMRDAMRRDAPAYSDGSFLVDMSGYIRDLAELCAPALPTLADMNEEERHDAVGMWADVDGFHPYRAVVGDIPAPKVPVFRPTAGSLDWVHPEDVTPLPELGRAWSPGGSPTGTPAPAPTLPDGFRLADHKDHGRVMVTTPTPNIEGSIYYVLPVGRNLMGFDWRSCDPDMLTYLDQEADTSDAVPESTLAVGSVWGSSGALAEACEETGRDQIVVTDKDGDVSVWGQNAGWWEGSTPTVGYEPFTIIHAGKKAHQ